MNEASEFFNLPFFLGIATAVLFIALFIIIVISVFVARKRKNKK